MTASVIAEFRFLVSFEVRARCNDVFQNFLNVPSKVRTVDASDFVQVEAVVRCEICKFIVMDRGPASRVRHLRLVNISTVSLTFSH